MTRSAISLKIRKAENKNINFATITFDSRKEYIYFAEYLVTREGNITVSEEPVELSLQEFKQYYERISEINYGDMNRMQI